MRVERSLMLRALPPGCPVGDFGARSKGSLPVLGTLLPCAEQVKISALFSVCL